MNVVVVDVLGSVRATVDGTPARLGGRRPRAVLAALLLARGRVLTKDEIVDAVWGESPPRRAGTTVHGHIADLRWALEPRRAPGERATVVVRHPTGYALSIDRDRVDAERFAKLAAVGAAALAEGCPAAAIARFDQALGLWRGTPYADLADLDVVRGEVVRLEAVHRSLLEDRLVAGLALGRHAELLGDLTALTLEHPLRERAWALLALAQYRCGRQAEALATLRSARHILRTELGIDPGRELRRLERRLLQQDPSLDCETHRAAVS